MRTLFLAVLFALSSISGATAQQASLRGTRKAVVEQNKQADKQKLTRLKDKAQIRKFVAKRILVPIPQGKAVHIDSRLDRDRRYTRPWTAHFLRDFGSAFEKKFGKSIQVNSAIRDAQSQRELARNNNNALPAQGPYASSHLTGATVDITHKYMSATERAWSRNYLKRLEAKGWVEATEERVQAVFHVMVYKNYGVKGSPKSKVRKAPKGRYNVHKPV